MKLRSTASTLAPSRPDFLNSLSQELTWGLPLAYSQPVVCPIYSLRICLMRAIDSWTGWA